jgi:hypothetical protein
MLTKLDKASPPVYGSTYPHLDIRRAVILPVLVVFGAVREGRSTVKVGGGQEPERVQRRRHLAQEQEVVGEPGESQRELAVTVFATDPEVDAGRGSPEVAPAAREHTGASHLPRPQERHDLVEEVVREGTKTIIGSGGISLDSVNFYFLAGHSVEQIACTMALDGRSKYGTTKLLENFAGGERDGRNGSDLHED